MGVFDENTAHRRDILLESQRDKIANQVRAFSLTWTQNNIGFIVADLCFTRNVKLSVCFVVISNVEYLKNAPS